MLAPLHTIPDAVSLLHLHIKKAKIARESHHSFLNRNRRSFTPPEALSRFRSFSATDSHDRVFGLLGIVKDGQYMPFRVDYEEPVEEPFTKCAHSIILLESSLCCSTQVLDTQGNSKASRLGFQIGQHRFPHIKTVSFQIGKSGFAYTKVSSLDEGLRLSSTTMAYLELTPRDLIKFLKCKLLDTRLSFKTSTGTDAMLTVRNQSASYTKRKVQWGCSRPEEHGTYKPRPWQLPAKTPVLGMETYWKPFGPSSPITGTHLTLLQSNSLIHICLQKGGQTRIMIILPCQRPLPRQR